MTHFKIHLRLDQAAAYQVEVIGRVEAGWADFLTGLDLGYASLEDGATITILTGTVADQAALHGLLNRIRDLGLPLLRVEILGSSQSKGLECF